MNSTPTAEWAAAFRAGLAAGRAGHSYLIVGAARGEGEEVAAALLRAVFCARPDPDGVPCEACRACRAVAARTHEDAVWIEPQSRSRQIRIEEVRERVLPLVQQTAFGGGWKAAVLLQAERLTMQAANALLKTLEEPPPRTLLLLVSDAPDRLPPTIVSRCRRLRVGGEAGLLLPEERARAVELMAGLGPGAGALERMAAAQAFQETIESVRARIDKETRAESEDAEKAEREARVHSRGLEARRDLLRLLALWQRDLLLCTLGGATPGALAFPEQAETLARQAAALKPADALRRIEAVEEAYRRLERNLAAAGVLDECFRVLAARSAAAARPESRGPAR